MKKLLLPIVACVVVFIALAGCITRYPDPAGGPPKWGANTNKLNAATEAANAINDSTAPFNPYALPIRGIIEGIGALAFGISTVVAGIKNGQLKTAQTVNTSIIKGVEDANPTSASPTKIAIQARAAAAGVQPHLDKIVQAVT